MINTPENNNQNVQPVPSEKDHKGVENINITSKTMVARGWIAIAFLLLCFGFLVYRLVVLQITEGDKNKNDAVKQYTTEVTIYAKRGNIYDRNMKLLASSSTVQTVFISPKDIVDDAQAQLIADGLSNILGVEKSFVLEKSKVKLSRYQVIKRNVEEETEMRVRQFIADNGLSEQVCLEESTKRYYPYGTLGSTIIGFVGADNNGLNGLEKTYENLLSGVNGRAIQGQDGSGNDLPFRYETYIDSKDGDGLVLTIDYTIQSILEKYLKECAETHKPTYGARGIIMDVNTGEILAMASIGDYDLNHYNELTGTYLEKYNEFNGTDEEKLKYKSSLLYDMWKNKTVTELYDPGSTFKIITASIGLEEGIFTLDSKYTCTGSIKVLGQTIHCHTHMSHGEQTITQALINSCNPAFVQMALDIGGDTFMKYFKSYGYADVIGSDFLGEAKSIYYKDLSNQLTLANYGFGQSMSITMLQHIAAVSAIANDGYVVTPHLIKSYVTAENTVKDYSDYNAKRAVISKKTADSVLSALVNSTKNAAVSGYNISSKTGTSQKLSRPGAVKDQAYYISSCVSFAPAEDPEIAILVVVDEPTGGVYYGSQVAAPVISSVLTEVLDYMDIKSDTDNTLKTYKIEDYKNADVARAKYNIESKKLNVKVVGNGTKVADQLPRIGTTVTEGGTVILYTDSEHDIDSVKVDNLTGMSPERVFAWIEDRKLNVTVHGIFNKEYNECYVRSQSIPAGSCVPVGTVIDLEFMYKEDIQ